MPDLRGLLADPQFKALPIERQKAILARVNPQLAEEYAATRYPAQSPEAAAKTRAGTTGTISATPWYQQDVIGGVSVQDAIDALPTAGGFVGGLLGGAGGAVGGTAAAGPPGGAALSVKGAVAGAAIGGAGGEAFRQHARRAIGAVAPTTAFDAAKGIGREGAIQAAAELGGLGLAAGARSVGKAFVENSVRPTITLQQQFPDVIETIVKERLPVGAGPFGKTKGSEMAAAKLRDESVAVKELLAKATVDGKTFEASKLAQPVLKLIDDIAEEEALNPGATRQLERFIENYLAKKKGPLDPLDVQKLKQAAQKIAEPIYKAVARGEAVSPKQATQARFSAAVAQGSKKAMEEIPGVAEGEAKKQALIGAKKALRQAEMRRLPLWAEGGAAVLGAGGLGDSGLIPLDDPFVKSAVGWLIVRGFFSPRAVSRYGLVLTSTQARELLRQQPRLGEFLVRKAVALPDQQQPEPEQ
jgi:hypothetical protein